MLFEKILGICVLCLAMFLSVIFETPGVLNLECCSHLLKSRFHVYFGVSEQSSRKVTSSIPFTLAFSELLHYVVHSIFVELCISYCTVDYILIISWRSKVELMSGTKWCLISPSLGWTCLPLIKQFWASFQAPISKIQL